MCKDITMRRVCENLTFLAAVSWLWLFCAPLWGALNNGFETDWIYAVRTSWDGREGAGGLRAFDEHTGRQMKELQPSGANWNTLTFAGRSNDAARLFVARVCDPDPAYSDPKKLRYRNVEIAELDAAGKVIGSVYLNRVLKVPWIGSKVKVGNIRYSQYRGHRNSIFVSAIAAANLDSPCRVYELDLELTRILNIYTGPTITDNPASIDFNPGTGTMYVVAQFLNVPRPQKKLGHGHLIVFNYAEAGTNPSKYNTLIKGEVYAGRDDSDTKTAPDYKKPQTVSMWHKPVSVVYRGTDHLDGRETVIVSSCW
ncbi:MAG: hypothetical protein ACYTA5_25340, partial [Planctomycetota bacterium]